MLVRPRRESDLDACLAIARHSRITDDYPPRGPIDLPVFLSPPQQVAAWVAEADGTVVGHVALHRTGAAVTVAAGSQYLGVAPDAVAVVARLMVGPGARRTGAGRLLLDTAAAEARAAGACTPSSTWPPNCTPPWRCTSTRDGSGPVTSPSS